MKKYILIAAILIMPLAIINSFAQSPMDRSFGLGVIVGEPTGVSIKYWNTNTSAVTADIGASYFGSPRLDLGYVWHFDPFSSNIVTMYGGPDVALGFGQGNGFWYARGNNGWYYARSNDQTGFGAGGQLGINLVPRSSPIEMFVQAGLLVGLMPNYGTAFDGAVGIRFYP